MIVIIPDRSGHIPGADKRFLRGLSYPRAKGKDEERKMITSIESHIFLFYIINSPKECAMLKSVP
jgi:hypothetical protein